MTRKKTPPQKPQTSADETEDLAGAVCPVVGVGASAGGMEAFSDLLQHLPADCGLALVLIQHLDPKHGSMLTELLAKATPMPVLQVTDGMRAEPNHVYVIPPNASMSIAGGILHLGIRPEHHMPIDHFFRALADDRGNRAIGVVLSGTASDGTMGLKTIKAAGGVTFAQDEKTARYDGMPRSAILAGCVDFILPPEGIAREIALLSRHPYVAPSQDSEAQPDGADQQYNAIFGMLRNATGVDFVYYKHATIRRRILRRMAVHRLDRVDQYTDFLRRHPEELQALFQDILINVTSFFREPSTFDTLLDKVFPALLQDREPDDPIRVWVPGCATGEEAYSIAMCLTEYVRNHDLDAGIQVFGTDLSETSLEKARAGVYPDTIAADVSAERLRRFFVKVNGSYQISRSIRDLCVFARQNLTKDPPFSRLDLILCRNVLIYLGPMLQAKVLRYFHYGLKPRGYLALGVSEAASSASELFAPLGGKDKIYAKKTAIDGMNLDFGPFDETRRRIDSKPVEAWTFGSELQKRVDQLILARHSPPGVVVDEDLKVLQFRGHTAPFLEHTAGQPSLSLLKMMRGGIGMELRKLVQKVKKTGAATTSEPMQLTAGEVVQPVALSVTPIKGPEPGEIAFLVLFENREAEEPRAPTAGAEKEAHGHHHLQDLESELAATRQYLQTVIEEQEAASEELKSAHEEVQSSNEELQSTNEELLTSKEELQSTNEELNTLNEEMQGRNSELLQINSDLNNLMGSISIPIVMLDSDLRIRRFAPQAEKVLNILPTDVGRRITDFRTKLAIPDLEAMFRDVIDNLHTKEREVQDQEGHTYLMTIRPYRTLDNKIDGAVMTLFDVTERRQAAEIRYRRLFEAAKDGIVVVDATTDEVLDVNPFVQEMLGYSRNELMGKTLWETPVFRGTGLERLAELSGSEPFRKTLVLRTKSAQQVDVELIANAYFEGRQKVIQMNLRDVSMHLRAGQAENLQAVGRLAGGVANDFNNLLTAIMGYSELLKARVGPDESLRQDIEEIRKAGERATNLAHQLMAFDRQPVLHPELLDLKTVLAGMDHMLRFMANERIELTVAANSTGRVHADRVQIEKVISNLVLNARDAATEGGKISIETSDAGDQVLLSVICDTSEGRHCAAFQIYLTRAKEDAESPAPAVAADGSETILLVDDEPLVRRMTAAVLRDHGYTVLEAANGPEALRIAREHEGSIDVLLTDVVMPRMSGREVSDRLSAQRTGVRIVFMSGHAEDVIAEHGVLDPSFAFLQKPFTPQALTAKIRGALDK